MICLFEKSKAIEAAKRFCAEKGLSVEKLSKQYKQVIDTRLYFGNPTPNATADLYHDMEVRPAVTLIVNEDYSVQETEHTHLLR